MREGFLLASSWLFPGFFQAFSRLFLGSSRLFQALPGSSRLLQALPGSSRLLQALEARGLGGGLGQILGPKGPQDSPRRSP